MNQATISIVCHNNLHHTKACIESVYRWSKNFDLIVTDNGSRDGTREYLETLKAPNGSVRVVTNHDNLGFSEPNRCAFENSSSPYFVTLNNDFVIEGEWLESMMERMRSNPRMAIVGVRGLSCGLTPQCEGFPSKAVEYVEASCMMVKRSVIESLDDGLFAKYIRFAYGEDSDLSLRAREAGYLISVADIPHKHAMASTTKIAAYRYRVKQNKEANHTALTMRWKAYLKHRHFNYNVLIIRHDSKGDVLFVTPIIDALKRKWPGCSISVQTNHPDIFLNHPNVFATPAKLDPGDFDFVFDLDMAYENRPHLHPVEAYSEVAGTKFSEGFRYRIYPSSSDLAIDHDGGFAIVHSGPTAWPGRNWPKDRFEAVIKHIQSKGIHVLIVGAHDNWRFEGMADVDLVGATTIHQLYVLTSKCRLFFGIDSFPLNVAQAAQVPLIGLFGTIDPKLRLKKHPKFIGLCGDRSKVPCVGEHHRLPPPVTWSTCKGDCMNAITVEDAKAAIDSIL